MRLERSFGLAVGLAVAAQAQIIDFESNGLHFKTLTKGGMTVMFAYLPSHLKEYSIVQVSISNGSPISWVVKPEDFSYRKQDGSAAQGLPALTIVMSLLNKASRHDVIKLVTTYEQGIYGNLNMQTTNGYEAWMSQAFVDMGKVEKSTPLIAAK